MHGKKLFVGGLNYSTTKEQLKNVFANYGEVVDIKIVEGKGFGFIEMSSQVEAESAKASLNNFNLDGKYIKVDQAKPPKSMQNNRKNHS